MKAWSYIITGLILIIEVIYIGRMVGFGLLYILLSFTNIFWGPLFISSFISGILLLLIGFKKQNKKTFISLIFSIIAVLILLSSIIYAISTSGKGMSIYDFYFFISLPVASILLFVSIIFSIIGMRESKKQ